MYSQKEANLQLPPQSRSRIEKNGVSIRDTIDLLSEGRKIIRLLTVLPATAVYLMLAPCIYKADALLRIDRNKALLTASTEADTPSCAT